MQFFVLKRLFDVLGTTRCCMDEVPVTVTQVSSKGAPLNDPKWQVHVWREPG